MAEGESEASVRKAYFSALREWVQQAQIHQNFSTCLPYYLMSLQNSSAGRGDFGLLNNNWLAGDRNGVAVPRQQPPIVRRFIDDNATPAEVIAQHGGLEYVVAPLYKRVIAEIIDFVLLFMLKLAITYVAVDYFNYIDVESFDVEALTKHFEDYKQAIEITSEIIVLEVIYRSLVCIFEASCLWAGGATPGKALMGIKVVSARAVLSTGVAGRILVFPGGEVSYSAAICRSLIKNILTSLLFPLFVFLFIFQDNRMGYDVMCGVVVVEENLFPARRNRP